MKNVWGIMLIVAMALVIAQPVWAQAPKGKGGIEMRKNPLGTQYFYEGRMVNVFGLSRVVKDCPEAVAKIKTAQMTYFPALLFSGIGGGLIGSALFQDEPLVFLAAGGVSLGAGLGLAVLSEASFKKGVNAYNRSVGYATASRTPSVQLALSPQSVAIRMRF